jgi:beta-1,4-mannosyl-glycoprotein beta-1,4-N-acetylglucosaminyltransferase
MKYSIIIPTYTKYEEAFKECLPSLLKYTDLKETEIIIVANGSPKETRLLVNAYQVNYNIQLVWFDEGLGYAKAVNEGIKVSKGEYVVLLNDDTILLEQQKNDWLEIMNKPFLEDDKMGLTAPMKTFSPSAGKDFLIFFCVMISRKVIDTIGLLDEAFYSYGEDTSYCIEAEKAGFKIKQVPIDSNEYYEPNRMTGNFPIYHEGNVSHKNWVGGEELIAKNNEILRQRYNNKPMVNIEKAKQCDGFMSDSELHWLAEIAKQCQGVFIEVGSWHGKSSRAIADNLHEKGVLICIDTWDGSVGEQDTNHASAKMINGDHAYLEFLQNNFDLIQRGKVVNFRMSSENAAKFFFNAGLRADAVFVDAGHTYEEVKNDITNWISVVKDNGILCGHDYTHTHIWGGVKKAVDELLKIEVIENTSIWATRILYQQPKPNVFDCFIFNNELDILERRLEELWETVDRFVIVEGMVTHGGQQKELVFHNNLKRFEKYLNKITYLVIENFPEVDGSVTDKSWTRERFQRDYIMQGLKDCKDNDIVIISDVDEIPNVEAIKKYKPEQGISSFEMDLYYYNEQTKAVLKWYESRITTYKKVKEMSPCGVRYESNNYVLENGGKHLSYFGGVEKIIKKIEDTAHQELNTSAFKDFEHIEKSIQNGQDLFNRNYIKFELCESA